MVTLRRTVRFCLNLDPEGRPTDDAESYNPFAARPSPVGLPRWYEIDATCRGEPDPKTGYLINIKDIDAAVRSSAVPLLLDAAADGSDADPLLLLHVLHGSIQSALPVECTALTLRLSPYHALDMAADAPSIVLIRTAFDLAAAHRLHCPDLSADENRRIFGKCNNPAGHGHNYRVEPCVALSLPDLRRHPFTIQTLEEVTDRVLIERFDHKHLNLDTPEFADSGGVNPSVENIARVFFDILAPAITEASPAATLRSVTVWETDRTCATFPG